MFGKSSWNSSPVLLPFPGMDNDERHFPYF
jgi:hypothetical protein